MFEFLNKKISTLTVIAIIVLITLLVGGILIWKYWEMSKETIPPVEFPEAVKGQVIMITLSIDGTYYPYHSILSIHNDGTVTYSESVGLRADATQKTGKITEQEFKELVKKIYDNDFFSLDKVYDNPQLLDASYITVTVKLDGEIYSVKTYGGEGPKSFYNIVEKLSEVEKKIKGNYSKNCDDYEMPMTEEEIRECSCPEGYQKFIRLSGAYCATNSQKPCSAHTDCPKGEHCISSDRKNWFCTGQFAGCYYRNPENLEEPMLCAD